MAFSGSVRDELARLVPTRECCRLAEVAGMAIDCGVAESIDISLSSAATARKVYLLLKDQGMARPTLTVKRHSRHHRYSMRITGFPGVVQPDAAGFPTRRCCRRAFVRGAFLVHGSIAAPDRTYHLEISLQTRTTADALAALLEQLGVHANVAAKRHGFVLYLKDGDAISEFLRLVEAHQSLLELENVRIVKGMKNRVNRLVNAETANVDKIVAASMQQVASIAFLAEKVGIDRLPYRLRAVARARLEMPYASLTELGASLDPRISKSAVNYRLRRLQALATELGYKGTSSDVSE